METNKKLIVLLEPLPGDRQGSSGAGAGRDSMRDIGGRVLSRRTPVNQNTTAELSEDTDIHQGSSTVDCVVQQNAGPTRAENQQKKRMKWDNNTNKQVMRSYFRVTSLETDLTMYRQRMHKDFTAALPHYKHLSEQRIADQRRAIVAWNLLPQLVINQSIRRELLQSGPSNLGAFDRDNLDIDGQGEINTVNEEADNNYEPDGPPHGRTNGSMDTNTNQYRTLIQKNIIQYRGSDPLQRPRIPVLLYKPNVNHVISAVNQELVKLLEQDSSLEDIHLLVYSGARAVIEGNGHKIYTSNTRAEKSQDIREPPWQIRLKRKIENLRKQIGKTQQLSMGNNKPRILQSLPPAIYYQISHSNPAQKDSVIRDYLDSLKQRLAALTKRLKRYTESHKRKTDNKRFRQSERQFYRDLDKSKKPELRNAPTPEAIQQFWTGI